MAEIKRNLKNKIEELLNYFPLVILLGVRQCGKTTLCKSLRPDWQYFDLERSRDYDLITQDIDFFFKEYPHSLIIDEAQHFPQLFQELRGIIDARRNWKNRFILTGSSSLELVKNVSESLAGRAGLVELGTFKINEIYALPLPPFYQIFESPLSSETIPFLKSLKPAMTYEQVIASFLKGGYPEPILADQPGFFEAWMENYYQTYVERDIRRLFSRLDLIKYRRFMSMLSSLSGTIINRSQVGRSLDISEKSVRDYLEIAEGSYIWRNVHTYAKSKSKSLMKMPKGFFRDSGLSHFLQGISNRKQLLTHPNVGFSFESFICEEIIKGLQTISVGHWNFYYFRTRNGTEIDLILEGPFGTLPLEIKLGSTIKQKQLQTLKHFVSQQDLPLGIVINNASEVRLVADKILQVPVGCL